MFLITFFLLLLLVFIALPPLLISLTEALTDASWNEKISGSDIGDPGGGVNEGIISLAFSSRVTSRLSSEELSGSKLHSEPRISIYSNI